MRARRGARTVRPVWLARHKRIADRGLRMTARNPQSAVRNRLQSQLHIDVYEHHPWRIDEHDALRLAAHDDLLQPAPSSAAAAVADAIVDDPRVLDDVDADDFVAVLDEHLASDGHRVVRRGEADLLLVSGAWRGFPVSAALSSRAAARQPQPGRHRRDKGDSHRASHAVSP